MASPSGVMPRTTQCSLVLKLGRRHQMRLREALVPRQRVSQISQKCSTSGSDEGIDRYSIAIYDAICRCWLYIYRCLYFTNGEPSRHAFCILDVALEEIDMPLGMAREAHAVGRSHPRRARSSASAWPHKGLWMPSGPTSSILWSCCFMESSGRRHVHVNNVAYSNRL